jgi:hypothetical protein
MARLQGLKAIAAYENKSEKTLRKLIREENYPAVLIGGGYESNTEIIERWRRLKIAEQCMTPENGLSVS